MKKNNNRLIGIIALILVIIIIFIISLVIKGTGDKEEETQTVTFSSTETTTELTTLPTTSETSTQTASETEPGLSSADESQSSSAVNVEFSEFENCAFLGNSRLLALGNYDIAPHVFAKVGLTVKTVFTDRAEGSSVTVIDELYSGKYDKVFIMFGDNECGWPNLDVFIDNYRDVINAVRSRQPSAKIYLLSCLPISQAKSAKNTYGYNMDALNSVNERVSQLAADEGLTYIDCGSSVRGSDGYLPDSYSTDGCHMKKEYNMIWAKYIADNM